jgi:hypothetical protein
MINATIAIDRLDNGWEQGKRDVDFRSGRQVLGAIAQFEKASLVAKLKAARDRKRARDGK